MTKYWYFDLLTEINNLFQFSNNVCSAHPDTLVVMSYSPFFPNNLNKGFSSEEMHNKDLLEFMEEVSNQKNRKVIAQKQISTCRE